MAQHHMMTNIGRKIWVTALILVFLSGILFTAVFKVHADPAYNRSAATNQAIWSNVQGYAVCTTYVGYALQAGGVNIPSNLSGNEQLIWWMKSNPTLWQFEDPSQLVAGDFVLLSANPGAMTNWDWISPSAKTSLWDHVMLILAPGGHAAGWNSNQWDVSYLSGVNEDGNPITQYLGVHIKSGGGVGITVTPTADDPGLPSITNPTDGATISTASVEIDIKPSGNPGSNPNPIPDWHVQIAKDSGFSQIVFDNSSGWWTAPEGQVTLAAGTYFVRIQQGDHISRSSTWTAPNEFTVNPTASGTSIFSQIKAANYTSISNAQAETTGDPSSGGQDVGWINNGATIRYSGIDFGSGGLGTLQARLAGFGGDGPINFRTGSASGPIFATVMPPNTGDWQSWTTVGGNVLSSPTGIQDVWVTFDNNPHVNFNWFQGTAFSPPTIQSPTDGSTVINTNPSPEEGVIGIASVQLSGSGSAFAVQVTEGSSTFPTDSSSGLNWGSSPYQLALPNFSSQKYKIRAVQRNSAGVVSAWSQPITFSIVTPTSIFSQIKAANYTSISNAQAETTSDPSSGGQDVGWINNGATIRYSGIDFGSGGLGSLQVRLAGFGGDGPINFRIGSASGPIFATVTPPNTGDWQSWTTVSGNVLSSPTGIQDVWVTFDNNPHVNFNWFQGLQGSIHTPTFTPTATATLTLTVTVTSSPTPTPTSTAIPPSATITSTPSVTSTETISATPSKTFTATKTFTKTATATATKTNTPTSTATARPTGTNSATPSKTFTKTATATATKTAAKTNTPPFTQTSTQTPAVSKTPAPSVTPTKPATLAASKTNTAEPTITKTPIPTDMPTAIACSGDGCTSS